MNPQNESKTSKFQQQLKSTDKKEGLERYKTFYWKLPHSHRSVCCKAGG